MGNRKHWWRVAREISDRQVVASDKEERSWALSSLTELEMLGTVYGGVEYRGAEGFAGIAERMVDWCGKLLQISGPGSFLVKSTIRQFRRYRLSSWHKGREEWRTLAESALRALGDG